MIRRWVIPTRGRTGKKKHTPRKKGKRGVKNNPLRVLGGVV